MNAAYEAQKKVAAMSLEDRGRIIDIIRRICNDRREELGRMELEETKVGRLDHKIQKLTNMRFVLGVEAHAQRCAQRHHRAVHHRARAVGRDRHDAAGDAFGADHGFQCDQYCCRGQHRGVRAASLGREGGAVRAAAVQSRDRARAGRGERVYDDCRADASKPRNRSSIIPRLRCCACTGGAAVVQGGGASPASA